MKNNIKKQEVIKIAKLAKLSLSKREINIFTNQLGETLSYVEVLNELDLENVQPVWNITDLKNVVRKDKIEKSLSSFDALKSSNSTYKGFFKVKGVLEK